MNLNDKKISRTDPAIDLDFLRDVTGNDRDFEKELFVLFLDSSKTSISKLETALADNNEDAWYAVSHSLKGASASIGAFYLAQISEYAQTHPKDEREKKSVVLSDIKAEFQRVADSINKEMAKA